MSEPKFTKGPWEVNTTYDEIWEKDVWYQTEYHSVQANGDTIASDVSCKANAALISASPEMYETLEHCLKNLLGSPFLRNSNLESEINRVLSKARGEE